MAHDIVDKAPPSECLRITKVDSIPEDNADHVPSAKTTCLNRLDKAASRLSQVIQTRQGHEITLLFAGEATRLISASLDLLASRTSPKTQGRLVPRILIHLARHLAKLSPRMGALLAVMDEWQIMWRLPGSLDMWIAARDLFREIFRKRCLEERVDALVDASQICALTAFYVFEGMAWLSSRDLLGFSPDDQVKLMYWSARGWFGSSCVEFVRAVIWRHRELQAGTPEDEWRPQWKRVLLRSLAWMLVTAHWSKEGGLLPDILVGAFGTYASASELRDLWDNTS